MWKARKESAPHFDDLRPSYTLVVEKAFKYLKETEMKSWLTSLQAHAEWLLRTPTYLHITITLPNKLGALVFCKTSKKFLFHIPQYGPRAIDEALRAKLV